MNSGVNRRDWLKIAGMAATGIGLGASCGTPATPGRRFAPVSVARDRIIRTTVGLRPYRASGFVVRGERFGEKIVIHNYGHGGSGMTLSWGTGHLAMEEALATGERTAAVVGAGAVGLATARLLQRHGLGVTIYAKDVPPRTTSNMSAAWFGPGSGAEPDRRTPAFMEQFRRAVRLSYRLHLPERLVMNCAGLGAKPLFDDDELEPIKGQLSVLLPQPEVDYMVVGGGLYMIPRGDGIVLGGTHERGDWSLEPSETEMQRVLDGNARLFAALG